MTTTTTTTFAASRYLDLHSPAELTPRVPLFTKLARQCSDKRLFWIMVAVFVVAFLVILIPLMLKAKQERLEDASGPASCGALLHVDHGTNTIGTEDDNDTVYCANNGTCVPTCYEAPCRDGDAMQESNGDDDDDSSSYSDVLSLYDWYLGWCCNATLLQQHVLFTCECQPGFCGQTCNSTQCMP
jgi:hypothetical protein